MLASVPMLQHLPESLHGPFRRYPAI